MASIDLEPFRLQAPVSTLYYIPNFIDDEASETLLKNFYGAPKPKWTVLKNRRLQQYGLTVTQFDKRNMVVGVFFSICA